MLSYEKRDALMARAVAEARLATAGGDVPVGAVITNSAGEIIATGHNHREADNDPTGHAELAVIREASRVTGSWRLSDCVLVVTLEPCVMCAGAILAARIPTVIFGAWDSKAGAAGSVYDVLRDRRLNHQVEVITGVREEECAALLTEFFRAERG
jgi:tRNA(adenine34) deaminase